VQKIWGVPPEELSGELARRRVGARSGADLVRRLRRPDPDAGTFRYPRRGFGEIVDRLADAAVEAGAQLRTRTRVTAVTGHGRVRVQAAGSDPEELRADHVFSTLPLPLLARVAGAPSDVLVAAGSLEHRALALVYIALPVRTFTAFDAHYLPEPEHLASRVSEPRNYRDAPDLDPVDHTVLCAEVPCSVGDERWRAPADALAARVMDDLAGAGLPALRPIHSEVRHVPHAYPVYRVGFEAAHEQLDRWVLGLDRVVSFGRQGLFAHDNTHHALLTGLRAAEALDASTGFDRARWEHDRSEFRTHVVED
jgi:protoporphyrinogen oxidase